MRQNQFARKKRQLSVLADKLNYLLVYHGRDATTQINKLIARINQLLKELARIVSRSELSKILGAAAFLLSAGLSSQVAAQSFSLPEKNPFGLTSVYEHAVPAAADLDGDGDLDLLVGDYEGGLYYFKNIGTAQNPQFDTAQLNPFGLNSGLELSFPEFVDLDGDGDLDLFVGEYEGDIRFFENTGSTEDPQFAAPQQNPFGLTSVPNHSIPECADLDNDGDFDLLVGAYYGSMEYFENTGSAVDPQFAAPLLNPFGLDSTYVLASPAFADLDGDGDFDLLVGEYYGGLQYFENTGSASAPQFIAPQLNPFGLISTYYLAFPEFADMDDDGDLDLLVGEYYGAIQYFENTEISGVGDAKYGDNLVVFPNPATSVLKIRSHEQIIKVEIYNMSGGMVCCENASFTGINIEDLISGIYTVKIYFRNDKFAVRKLIKE